MGEIKFGVSQRKLPTPSTVANPIDIFSGISGVVIAWLVTASFIPNEISNIISSILGLLTGIGQVLKPMFGYVTTRKAVDIKDVDTIDDSKDGQ